MCRLMYGLLHKLMLSQASGVAMFKAFLAARVWGMRLILGETFLKQRFLLWDQSATSQSLQKINPRLHWWFMNSSALGTFSWLNLVAWDIATSKISKHLVPSFLYLCIHPGVHQLSALTPRVMEIGTNLDHVKTEPWQWESKGRMKFPRSKTYWYCNHL